MVSMGCSWIPHGSDEMCWLRLYVRTNSELKCLCCDVQAFFHKWAAFSRSKCGPVTYLDRSKSGPLLPLFVDRMKNKTHQNMSKFMI